MKKAELKEMLKPIIKDCIKEVIFEDGVLSGIISEVAQGLGKETIVERKAAQAPVVQEQPARDITKEHLVESRKRMLHAIGSDAYNGVDLFEGSAPIATSGNEGPSAMASPLAGRDPNDAGVDISGIMNVGNAGNWSILAKGSRG